MHGFKYFHDGKLKKNSKLCTLGCKSSQINIFFYTFCSLVWKFPSRVTKCWGKRLRRYAKALPIEGQFTNHSLDLQRQQPEYHRKEVPYKFVMKRTRHRDVRSSQKYQSSGISTMIEISKKFDSCEAGSLPAESSITPENYQ